MKRKDLMYLQNVCALNVMCQSMDEILDAIEGDLPEMLEDEYQSLRSCVHYVMEGVTKYRIAEADKFMSACED